MYVCAGLRLFLQNTPLTSKNLALAREVRVVSDVYGQNNWIWVENDRNRAQIIWVCFQTNTYRWKEHQDVLLSKMKLHTSRPKHKRKVRLPFTSGRRYGDRMLELLPLPMLRLSFYRTQYKYSTACRHKKPIFVTWSRIWIIGCLRLLCLYVGQHIRPKQPCGETGFIQ